MEQLAAPSSVYSLQLNTPDTAMDAGNTVNEMITAHTINPMDLHNIFTDTMGCMDPVNITTPVMDCMPGGVNNTAMAMERTENQMEVSLKHFVTIVLWFWVSIMVCSMRHLLNPIPHSLTQIPFGCTSKSLLSPFLRYRR